MDNKVLKNLWLSLATLTAFAFFNSAYATPGYIYVTMNNQLSQKILFSFTFQNEGVPHNILFDKGTSSTSVAVNKDITAQLTAGYTSNVQQIPCTIINSGNYTPQTLSVIINRDNSCQATVA